MTLLIGAPEGASAQQVYFRGGNIYVADEANGTRQIVSASSGTAAGE